MKDYKQALTAHKFFHFFTDTVSSTLIDKTDIRHYAHNEIVFDQGDQPDGLYVVLDGEISLHIENDTSGDEVVALGHVAAGDFFGEFGVLDGKVRSARAVAQSAVAVLGFVPDCEVRKALCMPHENSAMKLSAHVLDKFRKTNARYVEEQLRRERMAVLGSMTSALVHDFKNPFTVITMCAEIIRMNYPDDHDLRDHCKIIQEQIERSCSMAEDVLDFVRGRLSLQLAPHPVEDFVKKLERLNSQYLKVNNVQWTSTCDSIEWSFDQQKLLRALQNLLNNAVESLSRKANRQISLTIQTQNNQLLITLRDNGNGIPEEIRERLFQSFVTHGKKAGTGLGLAISKSIIEAHGGTICCESEQNKGTAFIISLPNALE